MLLLTVNEWLGPGNRMTQEERNTTLVKTRQIAFATHMTLSKAIEKIYNYQTNYNAYYPIAVEFTLLHVTEIDDLTMDQLRMVRIEYVEELKDNFIA